MHRGRPALHLQTLIKRSEKKPEVREQLMEEFEVWAHVP